MDKKNTTVINAGKLSDRGIEGRADILGDGVVIDISADTGAFDQAIESLDQAAGRFELMQGPPRLFVCAPGSPEGIALLWDAIVDEGLGDRVVWVLQVNTSVNGNTNGRLYPNGPGPDEIDGAFPEDLKQRLRDITGIEATTTEAAAKILAERDTESHFDLLGNSLPEGQDFGAVIYDYEPRRRRPDGSIESWQVAITQRGYSDDDLQAVRGFIKGTHAVAQRETKNKGVLVTQYNTPRYPYRGDIDQMDVSNTAAVFGAMQERDDAKAAPMGWVWDGLYPSGDPEIDEINPENMEHHRQRVILGHRLRATGGYPTVPMLWPKWGINNELYASVYLQLLRFAGARHAGLWSNPHKINGPDPLFMARLYAQWFRETAPAFRHFLGVDDKPLVGVSP